MIKCEPSAVLKVLAQLPAFTISFSGKNFYDIARALSSFGTRQIWKIILYLKTTKLTLLVILSYVYSKPIVVYVILN